MTIDKWSIVHTVTLAVRDRHEQLTSILVTYGRTVFSRPYHICWTLVPRPLIFLGPRAATGSMNIVFTQ